MNKEEKSKALKIGVLSASILMMVLVITVNTAYADPTNILNENMVGVNSGDDSDEIDEILVPGYPPEVLAPIIELPEPDISRGINILPNVPAFDWCYGCSATAAAMMFGYYDNSGYLNMYAGPTNGGLCPMDNSLWGSGECPLSATHMGYDGLNIRGHVDDYWYSYGTCDDPYYGNWLEHGYADCTADFMGTNQYYNWDLCDGSTRFYYFSDGDPLYDYTGCEPVHRDGCHGIRLFVESRGYNVIHDGENYQNFNQYIDEYVSGGFTYADFMAEIDAGRPVIIHVDDHSMLGFGYDTANNLVYIHDTWDMYDHQMVWGTNYEGLEHYAVTVIRMEPIGGQPTISISTDKFQYSPGDSIIQHIEINNPTATSLMLNWYLGVPSWTYWTMFASGPIPSGYSYSGDVPVSVGNWGSEPFGIVSYVELINPATLEVLDNDVAACAYIPLFIDSDSEISNPIESIEESIGK